MTTAQVLRFKPVTGVLVNPDRCCVMKAIGTGVIQQKNIRCE